MKMRHPFLTRWLPAFPLAGHPVVEALVERVARDRAWRTGWWIGFLIRGLAPGASTRGASEGELQEAFGAGLSRGLAEIAQDHGSGARIYHFPPRKGG